MNGMRISRWKQDALRLAALLAFVTMICAGATVRAAAAGGRQETQAPAAATTQAQQSYATPQAALEALTSATESKQRADLDRVFGPESSQLFTGDRLEDNRALEHFSKNLHQAAELQKNANGSYTVLVGARQWPFPIPIVERDGRWMFDTKAGLSEILNRRIGENELSAIATCRAYVIAQWEYYTQSGADHDGLAVYAQRFNSTQGHHDGLYWPTATGETPSPFGELVAAPTEQANGSGSRRHAAGIPHYRKPYHGYFFRILKRQGPSAPGGKFDYVINGNMIAGYALIAYPEHWGNSGVMTFIVNQQGRVYQKNLGPDTAKIAPTITEYDPDPSWQLVEQ